KHSRLFIRGLDKVGLGLTDPRGVTLNDMDKFDAVLRSDAQKDKDKKASAQNVLYAYENAKDAISARYNDPNGSKLYARTNQGVPVLDANAVQQGNIGDCYFVSAVVALVRAGRGNAIGGMIESLQEGTKFKVTFPGKAAVFVNLPTYAESAYYSRAGGD